MPIPNPKEGETQEDFIGRCMGDETMKREYEEQDQRLAVCYSSWRRKHGGEPPEDMHTGGYGFKALSETDGEMWIYDAIGEGWFGGISAKQFAEDLRSLGKIKNLILRINSPGGDVFDGIAVYNVLRQHPAHVRVNVDGLAASIASVIAMAGDEIYMAENSLMMIHNAWGMAMGDAKEMREMAERLDKVSGTIHMTYLKRTGIDAQTISDFMAAETWFTAAEALENNFIDGLTEELKLAAHYDLTKFRFKNFPPETQRPTEDQRTSAGIENPQSDKNKITEGQAPQPAPTNLKEWRQWLAQFKGES